MYTGRVGHGTTGQVQDHFGGGGVYQGDVGHQGSKGGPRGERRTSVESVSRVRYGGHRDRRLSTGTREGGRYGKGEDTSTPVRVGGRRVLKDVRNTKDPVRTTQERRPVLDRVP